MPESKKYWVYILECENGSFYTGYTNNLIKRYESHVNGTASKYTRSFKPIKIAQCWQAADKSAAMRLEQQIKFMSRAEKCKIIDDPSLLEC